MLLTKVGEQRLAKLHPDLARVVRRCAADWSEAGTGFTVVQTIRTLEEQQRNVASGASQTMRSRHLPGKTNGLAHAVDLVFHYVDDKGKITIKWDWPLASKLAVQMKAAAKAEKVTIEWGGDWKSFKDGPHFQLPWASYPG